jgi:exopolysaccharide biosynthesis polyprenyl glycosylphosphotransferase
MIFLVIGVVSRVSLAARQRAQFMNGAAFRRVLVLGTGPASGEFIHFLTKRPWLGVACAGRLEYHTPDEAGWGSGGQHTPGPTAISATLHGFENLDRAWVNSGASEIVVALDPDEQHLLPEVTKLLSLAHVRFSVVPTLFEGSYHSAKLMGYGELPVIDVDVDPLDRVARTFKRTLDLSLSSILFVLCAIPLSLLVLALKVDSRGPVFYRQPRIGRNGRKFLMYKFRTMVVDADSMVDDLQDQNKKSDNGQLFKIKDDPRITRVGRFLRKWSLDELPQVINVYKGDMSLVGPRPPLPREVENYSAEHYTRLRGLPGITGLWQVSGRSDLTFEEMVRLDKYYLDNWSVKLDLGIMLKTIYVVLARKGAY